jgi:undecaprenyl diphosphate synthase
MDGNGRWAVARALPRSAGHKHGGETFKKIVKYAADLGLEHLTVYAFSTENWKRPDDEVGAIMRLLGQFLSDAANTADNKNIRVSVIGDTAPLSDGLKDKIAVLEKRTKTNTGMRLNIAFNYGGRAEIIRAAVNMASSPDLESKSEEELEKLFEEKLYTCGQPDVDLIIRTGGEQRLSNFLLWQSAYAEYYFTDKLWPDFTPADFDKATDSFSLRERRIGGVSIC